jgi:hypothetical protein
MASKKKDQEDMATETTEQQQPERKALNKAEMKALFDEYEKAQSGVTDAEAELKACQNRRSSAVREISEQIGNGPFEWKGQRLRIMSRGDTHYFLGEAKGVTKIG